MNLDKIQDDFIKESKELVKNIKTKLIHSVEKENYVENFKANYIITSVF